MLELNRVSGSVLIVYTYKRERGRVMMGYKEADLRKMMASISFSIGRFDDNNIDEGLINTIDFIQGLLAEGYITE